jgi:hypothetical protein
LSAASTASLATAAPVPMADDDDSWIIGPRAGYSPQIGILVSQLRFTREQVEHNVKGMTQADLDFLSTRRPTRSAQCCGISRHPITTTA